MKALGSFWVGGYTALHTLSIWFGSAESDELERVTMSWPSVAEYVYSMSPFL